MTNKQAFRYGLAVGSILTWVGIAYWADRLLKRQVAVQLSDMMKP